MESVSELRIIAFDFWASEMKKYVKSVWNEKKKKWQFKRIGNKRKPCVCDGLYLSIKEFSFPGKRLKDQIKVHDDVWVQQ